MRIVELRLPDGTSRRADDSTGAGFEGFAELVAHGVLASDPEPFDPMEKAFHQLAADRGPATPPSAGMDLIHGYGLHPELLAMTQVWQPAGGGEYVVACKGAPEAVAELCRLQDSERLQLSASVDAMAAKGLRVLGVAGGRLEGAALPESQWHLALTFLGLAGLADPVRQGVSEAVAECRSAGIRVVMVTGDYPATARAVAERAGIDSRIVLTGDEIESFAPTDLQERAAEACVFARVMPQQKLLIVEALKRNGEIVAMTGDGVNDAPSLKSAHIGIAMGGRGTDVAREASSLVLLDDAFASIVAAIGLGRRIYDNLRKAAGFIFAVHVPIAGVALAPLLFGLPLLLGPIHIALLEMVIDPVCSLVFEAEKEEADIMRRPPRPPSEQLFPRRWMLWSLFQGLVALTLVGGVYALALARKMPEAEVRAITFFALVISIVGLIFVNRSFRASVGAVLGARNDALGVVLAAVVAALGLSLVWPFGRSLLQFGPLHLDDLVLATLAGLVLIFLLQLSKRGWWRQAAH